MTSTDHAPVLLFLPAHDEAATVGAVIAKAPSVVLGHPVQVLVIDDGSTDATAHIARSFGERVTVICQPNGGPAAARNRALEATDGDCIAFLDADDRWHPEKVRSQVAFLRAHPECGLVHTAIRHIDADGRMIGQYVRQEIFLPLGMVDSWIGMPAEERERHRERMAPGLWIVRLRSPFDRAEFASAASPALARSARAELDRLLAAALAQPSP